MASISLTLPVSGTQITAGLHSTNYGAIQTAINGGLDNTNIASGAAIAASKLSGYPADSTKFLRGDGTWAATGSSNQLDYKAQTTDVTGISQTTEGTAATVITGNSISYDGSQVKVDVFVPKLVATAGTPTITFVLFYDTTVIGQVCGGPVGTATAGVTGSALHTPSASTHAYTLKAFVDSGAVTAKGGAGGSGNLLPAFLRVVKV